MKDDGRQVLARRRGSPPALATMLPLLVVASGGCSHGPDLPPGDARLSIEWRVPVGTDVPDLPHVEPVVAVNPADSDNIVVASIVVREPMSDGFYDSWTIHVLATTDGGETWTRHELPGLESTFAGDPWLKWAADGTLHLSGLVSVPDEERGGPLRVWLYESADGGQRWSGPVEAPAAQPGSLDHPVIDVAGERLFVFVSGDLPSILVSRTPESGQGLEALPAFRPDSLNNNLGSGVGFDDDRFVFSYFSMSVPQPSPLWAVRPSDDGSGYEMSEITSEHIPVGFPMMAMDRSSGPRRDWIYSVWTRSNERPDVMIAHSDDFGASWSAPTRVQADTVIANRTMPAVAVNGAGTVMVAWVDGRHHEGDCWDVYAAASLDGGATFVPERRLTPEPTCPAGPGNGNGAAAQRWRWGGDYIGLDADANGAFHVVWADSRTGTYQLYMAQLAVD